MSLVVATCFLETGVATFDLESTGYFNKCDADPKAMTPRVIIQKLKAKYVSLEGRSQWPHKNQKQKQDDLSAMHGKLNALQQKIDTIKSNNNKPSTTPSSTRDLTNVTCFKCNKKGHLSPNCPYKTTSRNDQLQQGPKPWMLKPPGNGESEIKTMDGKEYKWCSKCKLGKDKKPMWHTGNKKHITSECKSKAQTQYSNPQANTLQQSQDDTPVDGPLRFLHFG